MANNEKKFTTRSGIEPDFRKLPFAITTTDVKNYIQLRVDGVLAKMGTNETVEVGLITAESGKRFLPFYVSLPLSVLKSNNKKSDKMESIFDTKDDDGTANLIDPIYKLFSAWSFNKDDERAFFSDDWRRLTGVNRRTSPVLKHMRIPRVAKISGELRVAFLIDPIRIFHSMLIIEGDNRDFRCEMGELKKLRSGEFEYNMIRRIVKPGKGNKGGNSMADELNRKMRGFN